MCIAPSKFSTSAGRCYAHTYGISTEKNYMKFLTFVDIHEDVHLLKELLKRAAEPDIDFIICAGDFTSFGRGIIRFLKEFEKVGKKLYLIPGNHEEREGILDITAEFPNVVNLHK